MLSIFELADLWSESTDELDYVVLINKLFRRVTTPAVGRTRHQAMHASGGLRGGTKPRPMMVITIVGHVATVSLGVTRRCVYVREPL